MKKTLILLILCYLCIIAQAQPPYPTAPPVAGNITGIEYFYDSKQDFGNGTALTGYTTAPDVNSFAGTVSLAAVTSGFHRIFFRSRDINGKWSFTNNAFFDNYIVPVYNSAPSAPVNITGIEYYIDANQLFGSGTALTGFTTSTDISSFNGSINLGTLTPGFHRFYIRSKNANGIWGLTQNAFFDNYTVPLYNIAPAAVTNIVQLEYFFDNNDLGFGNCNQLTITANTNIANQNANINITGLSQGVHRLFIRSKDATGKWSLTNFSIFDNASSIPYPSAPAPVTNMVQVEYFIDNNDAGFGNCTAIPFTAGTNIANLNANINISGLPSGVHRLYIRGKDAHNKWSLTNFSVFDNSAVMPYPIAPVTAPAVSNMEYFIDTDPGFGNATPISVPGNTGDIVGYNINLNLSGSLTVGTHYLFIRSKQNPWSLTNVVPFNATGVVPILWSFVKAQVINNQTLVSWGTDQEINTQKFEIEHSIDGRNFSYAGEVNAAGNSSSISKYNFTHLKPISGFNYYRIKQKDNDGSFKYSVIVKVLNSFNIKQPMVAPNPVSDLLNVIEPVSTFITSAEVYDSKGSLVFRKNINTEEQVFSLPVSILKSGNYMLKINYKKESKLIRFVKE